MPRTARRRVDFAQGSEREIAILFADIRGFTALAEGRLPYDVVFMLNRYFAAMGRAVEAAGGRVDKFIGDGVMALFGDRAMPRPAAAQALAAARLMSLRLDELNVALRAELAEPLRIGIGIHAGPVIVGEMGYGGATTITAIGDAVNTASRLESLTKEFGVQLMSPTRSSPAPGSTAACSAGKRPKSAAARKCWGWPSSTAPRTCPTAPPPQLQRPLFPPPPSEGRPAQWE